MKLLFEGEPETAAAARARAAVASLGLGSLEDFMGEVFRVVVDLEGQPKRLKMLASVLKLYGVGNSSHRDSVDAGA